METDHRIRFFIEYRALRLFYGWLGRLPPAVGLRVGRGMGQVVGLLAARRTQRARENLAAAFPREENGQIRRWARDVWSELGAGIYEFARLGRLSVEEFRREVHVTGLEHLHRAHAQGKGVILVTGHLGNWEYTSWATAIFSGLPTAVIARRMKNPWVNDWITQMRRRSGCEVWMHKNAVRESLRWLSSGGLVGLLFDQRITTGGLQTPFFGRPAWTTGMPALLSLRLGSPIVPVSSWRDEEGIHVDMLPALAPAPGSASPERVEALTRQLNLLLESWVRARPAQWLWIHNRWKL